MLTSLAGWQTLGLLLLSNLFMTVAWYGHLKNMAAKPWWIAALLSWGIALFEYLLQVPANRIWLWGRFQLGPAQNHAGGDHFGGLRAVFSDLHGAALQDRLHMGRSLSDGCGLFHLSRALEPGARSPIWALPLG